MRGRRKGFMSTEEASSWAGDHNGVSERGLGTWPGTAALFQAGLCLLPGGTQGFWLMTLKSLWLRRAGHVPCVFPTGTESSRQSPGAAASPYLLSFNRDAAAASPQTASFAWGSLWASGLPAGAGAEPGGPVVWKWVAAAQGWQDLVARQSSLLCGR